MSTKALHQFSVKRMTNTSISKLVAALLNVSVFIMPVAIPSLAYAETPTVKQVYRIPGGTLSTTLSQFAAESGVLLSADAALAEGKSSKGLQGSYSVEDGFNTLLAGSGLEVKKTSSGGYKIQKMAPELKSDSDTLPQVDVSASTEKETSTSHVVGYVAKHSATATKTDTLLIENPQSVSVITADEINDRKAESLDEVLRYTTGVTPNQRALGSDDSSLLRGFEIQNTGIYLDGLLNSGRTFSSTVEPYGLERLEVLRGPASVLYGQSPPGGMLNAVSKRPTSESIKEVGVEYGSYNRKQLKGDFGGALDDAGVWTYRLTMLGRESNTRLDHDKDDRLYIAPALTWRPNDNTKLTLLAKYQTDNQQYAFPNQLKVRGAFGQIDPSLNISGFDNRFERTNKSLGYEFEHKFNETWAISQKVRYTDLDNNRTDIFPIELEADGRSLDLYFRPTKTKSKSIFTDTNMKANFNTGAVAHTVLLGVDYSNVHNLDQYPYQAGFVTPLDVFDPVYNRRQVVDATNPREVKLPSTQIGVYVQDQIKWQKLVVTAGLRNDNADQKSTTKFTKTGVTSVGYDQSADATTGRLGVVYLFDSGFAPYFSYATSFAPEIGSGINGSPLKPSEGRQSEVGLRYQPSNQRVTYTAAVFDLVRHNVRTSAPGNPGVSLQAGEISSKGLELEARAELARNLSVVSQYTYLDTEVTKSNDGDKGLSQKGAPKNSASVWSKYSFAIGNTSKAYAALGVRYIGQARSNTDYNNEDLTNPSFTLVDASVGLEQGHWRFSVNVNNLLNKQKLYDCGYLENICYRSAERTGNLSAVYQF